MAWGVRSCEKVRVQSPGLAMFHVVSVGGGLGGCGRIQALGCSCFHCPAWVWTPRGSVCYDFRGCGNSTMHIVDLPETLESCLLERHSLCVALGP